jgi:ribosomal protein L37AE/L43A
MDDDRAPICPVCGVTMLAADQSTRENRGIDWVCVECEETGAADET